MLGIGLIGAGRIGSLHAENIRRSRACRLVTVFDANQNSGQALASLHGASAVPLIEDVLLNTDVSAVFVCSPTDTHVDILRRIAPTGKAIFCEKPIDLNISHVRNCLSVLEERSVPFTIGFHRRFDPHHRALRDAVHNGAVGEVEQIRIVSRDPAPPPISYIKRSGGIFRDMMIHDLDQCRFLLPEPLIGVFAKGSSLIDPEIEKAGDYDAATATFWTTRGVTCSIQNSRRCAAGFDQRIEVFGSKGTLSLENVAVNSLSLGDGSGFLSSKLPEHFPQRYNEAYRLQLEAFVDAVSSGRQPDTRGYDGLMSLVLADAAEQSARTGSSVVIPS